VAERIWRWLAIVGAHPEMLGAVEFGEDFDHGSGGAGCFAAAIEVIGEASAVGLLLVVEEEDFVDDGGGEFKGEVLQGLGDGSRDEVGVGGLAADEHSEGDDAPGLFEFEDRLGGDGDFEGPGDADEVDAGLGEVGAQFLDGAIDHGVRVAFVEFGRDDGQFGAPVREDARFRRESRGHVGGIAPLRGDVNPRRGRSDFGFQISDFGFEISDLRFEI